MMRTMKEVIEDGRPYLLDIDQAQGIEIAIDTQGKVWVNVDGACVFRCGLLTGKVIIETPKVRKEITR